MSARPGARPQTSDHCRHLARINKPHCNARLTVCSRERIVTRIGTGQSATGMAATVGVPVRTVRKWFARFKAGRRTGFSNRASAPAPAPSRLPDLVAAMIAWMRAGCTSIAPRPGLPQGHDWFNRSGPNSTLNGPSPLSATKNHKNKGQSGPPSGLRARRPGGAEPRQRPLRRSTRRAGLSVLPAGKKRERYSGRRHALGSGGDL